MGMHSGFADWYRKVAIEPKSDDLKARWQGVVAFAHDAEPEHLPMLTQMFFGKQVDDDVFLQEFRNAFKKADDTFPMADNDAELSVLAGGVLVQLLSYKQVWGSAAALSLVCATLAGYAVPPVPAIVAEGERYLTKASSALRQLAPESEIAVDEKVVLELWTAAVTADSLPQTEEPFKKIVNVVGELIGIAKESERQLSLLREESNVLWWLYGGYSRDFGIPVAELKEASVSLVVAKELADLVNELPGPPSIDSFLVSALSKSTTSTSELTLYDALSACSEEWRTECLKHPQLAIAGEICPVHVAMQRSIDIPGKAGFNRALAKLNGGDRVKKIAAFTLSRQFFNERLLLKALGDL